MQLCYNNDCRVDADESDKRQKLEEGICLVEAEDAKPFFCIVRDHGGKDRFGGFWNWDKENDLLLYGFADCIFLPRTCFEKMKPLLFLHGALGSRAQFDSLRGMVGDEYDVHPVDFSGHGDSEKSPTAFSMELFAQDVLDYMDTHGLAQADIFGYSMGGYVGLYLARHHAQRVGKIATLATKLHWDEAASIRETGMLDPHKMELKVPQLATALQQRHAGKDWKEVVHKTASMLLAMGRDAPLKEADFKALQLPVLLLLGDRDKMVSLEETVAVYKIIPGAKMGMLPGTPHPFEQVDGRLIAALLECFFRS